MTARSGLQRTASEAGTSVTAEVSVGSAAGAAARLRILVDISRRLAEAHPDLEVVLDSVASRVTEVLGDGCAAYLRAEDGQTLEPVTIRHRDPSRRAIIEQVNRARRLRIGEGMVGRATASGETLFLPDTEPAVVRGLVVPEYLEYLDRVGVRSLLVTPLTGKQRVHGALWLARDPGSEPYTQEDRELVEAIADCAALALDGAQLHATHDRGSAAAGQAALAHGAAAGGDRGALQRGDARGGGGGRRQPRGGLHGGSRRARCVLPDRGRHAPGDCLPRGPYHGLTGPSASGGLPVTADNPVATSFREGRELYFREPGALQRGLPHLRRRRLAAGYDAAAALPLQVRDEVLGVLWVRFTMARRLRHGRAHAHVQHGGPERPGPGALAALHPRSAGRGPARRVPVRGRARAAHPAVRDEAPDPVPAARARPPLA